MVQKTGTFRNFRDKILVLKTKKGNHAAYAEIYDRYFQIIFKYVFFQVRTTEIAEDIASEVFLKVFIYIQEGKTVENVRALLYKVARNLTIDYYRKKKEVSLEEVSEIELSEKSAINDSIERNEEREQLKRAIAKLKDEYRDVIILRYMQDLTNKEIAQILNKKENAVRILVYRAQKALKQAHEEQV